MTNLLDTIASQPLVILKEEYGIVKGDEIIASPNAKSGVLLILSDAKNKITAMAHFENEQKIEESLDKILDQMKLSGADIKNLKCNLIEHDRHR